MLRGMMIAAFSISSAFSHDHSDSQREKVQNGYVGVSKTGTFRLTHVAGSINTCDEFKLARLDGLNRQGTYQ